MRTWVNICDANYAPLGSGPLSVLAASVNRRLDQAGAISFSVPGTSRRALELLQTERRVVVYTDEGGQTRELSRGIIQQLNIQDAPKGWNLSASGTDALDEFKRKSVLLGRKYSAATLSSALTSLTALVPGWTYREDAGIAGKSVTARFDGVSALKALQSLIEQQGVHLRLGSGQTLEAGTFGTPTHLIITNVKHLHPAAWQHHPDVFYIEKLTLVQDSEALVNWIIPLGAGQGESAVTLQRSTRTMPYPIRTLTGPDGRTLYYLKHPASCDQYGEIQKTPVFKEIAIPTNSEADLINGANALYDIAAATLDRYSLPYESYCFTVRKPQQTIRPGDKIRIIYTGVVFDGPTPYQYRELNDDFWVLEVTERTSKTGLVVDLVVANLDRHAVNNASIIVGALETLHVQGIQVQPYPTKAPYPFVRDLDPTHPANIPVWITNTTLRLDRCLLRLLAQPFRSNAKSGGHRHLIAEWLGDQATPAGSVTGGLYEYGRDDNQTVVTTTILALTQGNHDDLYTKGAAGAQEYGIYDDTVRPGGLRIAIDGLDRTAQLLDSISNTYGPWGTPSANTEIELEISDFINTALPLRRKHTVTISCTSGQGSIEAVVELYEQIQTLSAQTLS